MPGARSKSDCDCTLAVWAPEPPSIVPPFDGITFPNAVVVPYSYLSVVGAPPGFTRAWMFQKPKKIGAFIVTTGAVFWRASTATELGATVAPPLMNAVSIPLPSMFARPMSPAAKLGQNRCVALAARPGAKAPFVVPNSRLTAVPSRFARPMSKLVSFVQ